MGSILKDILEAEKQAREFAAEAEKYRADAVAEIEEEKKQIIQTKMKEAQAQVEKLREQHRKSIDLALQTAEKESRSIMEALLTREKEKSDEWISAIFNRVLHDES